MNATFAKIILPGVGLILACQGLGGCYDRQLPSRERLLHDLQSYYSAHPTCSILAMSFPAEIQSLSTDPYNELLAALVSHGLVRRVPSQRQDQLIKSVRFEITPQGEKYIHARKDRNTGGTALCYAARQIVSVESLETENRNGAALVTANYTYKDTLLGAWASDPEIWHIGLLLVSAPQSDLKQSKEVLNQVNGIWVPTDEGTADRVM